MPRKSIKSTYKSAGVSIEAGELAVRSIKSIVKSTYRPEVVGDIGGFAGLFKVPFHKYDSPVLASSTDGVGTKLAIASALEIHNTVGIDLVAMVVDDLVVIGAEPLFLQDYIACGKVYPETIDTIVSGIAEGCKQAGCSLIGGEIAEHPGLMLPGEYDLSATGVGIVEETEVLGADKVRPGDVIIAFKSSGLHSNGFAFVRHILSDRKKMDLDKVIPELSSEKTLGEVLLTPTTIYAKHCLTLAKECDVRAFAHITGGGIPGNLSRVIPENLRAVVYRGTWKPQPIFDFIKRQGSVSLKEMESTFNMGVGMLAIIPVADLDRALAILTARGVESWWVGGIVEGEGEVDIVGNYKESE